MLTRDEYIGALVALADTWDGGSLNGCHPYVADSDDVCSQSHPVHLAWYSVVGKRSVRQTRAWSMVDLERFAKPTHVDLESEGCPHLDYENPVCGHSDCVGFNAPEVCS